MKKTTSIVLTIVSGLSFKTSIAQNSQQQPYDFPPDTNCVNMDSVLYCQTPPVEYTYYFQSHFCNSIFRYCFPRRYFYLTHPGFQYCHQFGHGFHHQHNQHLYYGPHHVTGATGHRLASASSGSPRGGFGHFGTTHTIAA
ncbi:MAG TPA: hypothetical protein VK835_10250 [Bacteroidia bacterium]|jgi:hypothetical protein|nr:hypothetical protein [Bacteroidia bacterium]